ncbi:MAG: hypothetical protein ACE5EF_06040 [Dehalococcoidia bacterium]
MSLSERVANRLATDGEFRLASRYWTGRIILRLPAATISLSLVEGAVSAQDDLRPGPVLTLSGSGEVWERLLADVPPPGFNDLVPARLQGLEMEGDEETLWQYYPALRRLIDVLREEGVRDAAV